MLPGTHCGWTLTVIVISFFSVFVIVYRSKSQKVSKVSGTMSRRLHFNPYLGVALLSLCDRDWVSLFCFCFVLCRDDGDRLLAVAGWVVRQRKSQANEAEDQGALHLRVGIDERTDG